VDVMVSLNDVDGQDLPDRPLLLVVWPGGVARFMVPGQILAMIVVTLEYRAARRIAWPAQILDVR